MDIAGASMMLKPGECKEEGLHFLAGGLCSASDYGRITASRDCGIYPDVSEKRKKPLR
ncbi:hypothetical protein [Halobacillus sp. Marseille-Q1614]|uniref:hypothetical protein n=1 Tax=Halobacillus sp. Marseille-Q1614 TaxID=2709134 RepID=UPI00156F989A|nr:hypothetical protein [Halobacillus sp. Marseille-Q1614]